jgi:aldehyde:ferredoxin oxidoreductase
MLLFEKGILTEEDTGGIKLEWGDKETALKLMKMIAYREGFGDVMADGTKKMAQKIGRGAEFFSKNIKGAEVIADTRLAYEVTLAEGVSPRGACHLKGLSLFSVFAHQKGYLTPKYIEELQAVYESPTLPTVMDPRWAPYGTRYLNRLMSAFDSLGLCVFSSHYMLFHAVMLEDLPGLYEAATGESLPLDELKACADRARIIQRSYSHKLGLDRKDDYPPKLTFEAPLKAVYMGKKLELTLDREVYGRVLTEFYTTCGYDEETGIPTRKTLENLELQDIARDLEKNGLLRG